MKKWVVRIGALFVFDYIVIVVMGLAMPRVNVGPIHALWAALLLAVATLWLKPVVRGLFEKLAADGSGERSRFVGWLVKTLVVYAVAFVIWYLVVWLSKVDIQGWLWGYLIPPLVLLVVWWIYDAISDRFEAQAAKVYDQAFAKPESPAEASGGPAKAAEKLADRAEDKRPDDPGTPAS